MARIHSKGTQPELALRRLVHGLGYRYRLHDQSLPGKPDTVFRTRRAVIFVHGCFWHQHACGNYKMPATRQDFWSAKLAGNNTRDQAAVKALEAAGWRVLVIWECELRADIAAVGFRVIDFLEQ
jgi:DNA mismatch endonuclease (patch repair protein)